MAIVVPFAFVDVFTQQPLTGNPLTVVPYARDLDVETMQRLAREFNQIETTFIIPPTQPSADWQLRSFTAIGVEVFGAGHNALGAWWWLAASGTLELRDGDVPFHQQLGPRVLPLTIHVRDGRPASVGMVQSPPSFGAAVNARADLAAALGLRTDQLMHSLPAQVVATDVAHLMVPLSGDALGSVRPVPDKLAPLVASHGAEGCYVFGLEPHDKDANAEARFFNPGVGIAEDPATGTAAGPLAAYLIHHKIAAGPRVIIDQGFQTGRPSRLEVRVDGSRIELRGAAVVTAEGTIRVE